ncbi:MAG: UvrD-helicase domain-containing protein [Syntrophobacteraceae bacterium]
MNDLRQLIETEETRLQTIVGAIRTTLKSEEADRQGKEREIEQLKRQKLDAAGWQEKRDLDELIDRHVQQKSMRHYQEDKVLSQPYFGVLELDDDKLGKSSVCLGRQSFFAGGKALVIDWREAPISRLYYEYESGELYEEEIRGQERSGIITAKRQVETAGAVLSKIAEKGLVLVRSGDGWQKSGDPSGVIFRKEEAKDHRLPEITALIDRNQFRAIASPESSIVLLQGGAGSGKTTVALHRIAYLHYQDKERFRPERMMVVVFNRSLQKYLSKVLPDLGVSGVRVDTYHAWAGKIFRSAGARVSYGSEEMPGPVARLKKSSLMLALIERHLKDIVKKACAWLAEQLEESGMPAAHLRSVRQFQDLYRGVSQRSGLFAPIPKPIRERLFPRMLQRLKDHEKDLRAALGNRELLESTARDLGIQIASTTLDDLFHWQDRLRESGRFDFTDTGLLLWLLQTKGIPASLPAYSHVMVDEAQDFSEVELATLVAAADGHQSVTICGDMAQKIKGEFDFSGSDGFAGFIKGREVRMGTGRICADSLVVGYRATRPIMEAAWHVLGESPPMKIHRDGEPVTIIETTSYQESLARSRVILAEHVAERPKSLVAVICLYPRDADRLFLDLKALGLEGLRRHSRDDFTFAPGIIVTSAHQVKGLEFSAVLAFNPSASQYRDNREHRMLLHVVFTRAAEHLWVVGHQPLAYGLVSAFPATTH